MRKLICPILIILSLISCKNNDVSKFVNKRIGSKVEINVGYSLTDSLLIDSITKNTEYLITIPINDNACGNCSFHLLGEIDEFIEDSLDSDRIKCIAFVSKGYSELRDISSGKLSNVYLIDDVNNNYLNRNKLNDYTINYTTFLLDHNTKIRLVGNPIYNYNVRKLYCELIHLFVH